MNTIKGRITTVFLVLVIAAAAYMAGISGVFSSQRAIAAPVLYSADTVTSVYDEVSPAVVEIDVTQGGTGFLDQGVGQGSGFLIDADGHILTNNHVVDGATSIKVVFKWGDTVDAKVIGTDAIDDLAIVGVDASAVQGITPLQLGDSTTVKIGQMAIAIGTPYGLYDSCTVGIISGLNRSVSGGNLMGMLQTDASINPGNSGGPLLDVNGTVIGINTAIESTATGANGIGFAVPSNVAKMALPDLVAGKHVSRPWLGISGTTLTSTLAQTLGLSIDQGAYVITVNSGSPAERAGLKGGNLDVNGNPAKGGDVITAVDGKTVTGMPDLSGYILSKKVGDIITLSVLRDGSEMDIQLALGAWPSNANEGGTPTPTPQLPQTPPGWRFRQQPSTP
jgi:S1-C subfamily serine protease